MRVRWWIKTLWVTVLVLGALFLALMAFS